MAKTYSALKSNTSKASTHPNTERFYTVGYMPQDTKPTPKLQLNIKGRWLTQIGFYVGCPVIIKSEQDKLIIKLAMQI